MRQIARTKQVSVSYKGWTLFQTPWNAYGRKQYAKALFDPTGRERLHAGYSGYCTHRELGRMIRGAIAFVNTRFAEGDEE